MPEAHVAEEVEHLDVGDEAEGRERKCWRPSAGMAATKKTKKARSRYLRLRRGMSSQRGRRRLRRKSCWPSLPEVLRQRADGAEPGAEGFLGRRLVSRKTTSRNMAAGWMAERGG